MKKIIALAALCAPVTAFAHGSLPEQAADAIRSSAKIFAQTQPKELQRAFRAATAVKTGHEQFAVTFTLANNAQLNYACQENEEVDPVVWECQAK